MKTSSKAINRGIWSLRCSRKNCPPSSAKPCWLHGQYGQNRPLGVDIVGYLLSEIGLGEAARLMVRALDAANIPAGLVSVPLPGRMSETSMTDRMTASGRHSLALSILPVAGLATFARRNCRGQRNIADPFWELPTIPKSWRHALDGFDAYWAPTTFVRDVLLDYQGNPPILNGVHP